MYKACSCGTVCLFAVSPPKKRGGEIEINTSGSVRVIHNLQANSRRLPPSAVDMQPGMRYKKSSCCILSADIWWPCERSSMALLTLIIDLKWFML